MLQELLAGRLDFASIVAASATPFTKAGTVRLLAMMSTQQHPDFPDVPTLQQAGYPVTQLSCTGIYAPKETPAPVVMQLEKACEDVLVSDEPKQTAQASRQVLNYQSSAEMEKMLVEQFELQGQRLRAVGAVK